MNPRVQRILLLQMSGVLQQNSRKLNRRRICEDWPAIARFRQHRQPSRVVQVRVRENEIVDRFRADWQRLVVAILQLLRTLKNPAVHQQAFARCFDEIFRTRNASRRAQKSEFCHRFVF